jgi:D-3-phosphoglycerate dehydrogenase
MKTSFPKDKIRVSLLEGVHPRAAELLSAEGFQVRTFPKALSGAELRDAADGAHVVGIRSKTRLDNAFLEAAAAHSGSAGGRLLAVGCFCIGTEQVDATAARAHGVPVFNSPFSNTRSVAELTIGQVIALSRRMTDRNALLHKGVWDKSAAGSSEVRGKTLGIVGYGHIGSQVSVLGEAMGMRVIYHDVVPRLPMGNAKATRTLDELLGEADVVTLHVPGDASTLGPPCLMSGARLAKMRPGSIFINNARGGVVDIPALATAIKSGHIAGAALDVFPREPSGKDEPFASELLGLGNVILTPHVAGSTQEAQEAIGVDVATKLARFINNGSTTGAVNVPEVELPSQSPDPHNEPRPSGSGLPQTPARPHRILHFHRNVPGVLSRMHGLIAALGGNITGEYLRTTQDIGYVVVDIDPVGALDASVTSDEIARRLREIPETIRVRVLW